MHDHSARPSPGTTSLESDPEMAGDGSVERPGHSMWWMVACCAPMVLIALALALGVLGSR